MKLYFSPLAGSMATRIAFNEFGRDAEFVEVCPYTKRTRPDDDDYLEVHSLGLIPALVTDDGVVLTENAAILLFVADASGRAPSSATGRAELQQWLGFIAAEIHKVVFAPHFDSDASEAVKTHALTKTESRLAYLDSRLASRSYLVGDEFGVADAYLVTMLHAAQVTPIDLSRYPNVAAYLARHLERPSVAAAVALELPLYVAEQKRIRKVAASA